MGVLKPAALIILLMLGYAFFKPGKIREVVKSLGRSVGAFREGMNEEDDAEEERPPKV